MPFPTIVLVESSRTLLRAVLAEDLADLMEVNGDPQVTQFLPYATWQTLEDGIAWLGRMQALQASGSGQQLVLQRRCDGKVIGSLLLFKFDEASARVELGYVLGRSHWGQGLMSEAVRAVCAQAFGTWGVRRMEAEINPLNAASCGLLERAGFLLEGTLRQRWVAKGLAYDTRLYAALAHEWLLCK